MVCPLQISCPGHNLETSRDRVIALCLFYTLNFVQDITQKLQEIALSKNAALENCHSALPNFGVIDLCLFYTLNFLHFDLCPEHYS